ncbi:MAG: nitrite/sulfite reductase, partial [Gammaproteobacteria bacterium]|nr:nitrite/sulfite reductase [Gammaproteobacteria bacterium]
LNGELPEEEFLPLRLRNGLYYQRHAYMLRIAIPYGLLASTQVRMLAHIARDYDKGFGHFTTRQNIQFNWPELEDVPDILDKLASVEMHAIQTSGNCIRNTSTDHLAGAAKDELEDPRPYCEIIRQWSTLHPEFDWLPRKFKIAVSGAQHDRAAIYFHDIGLRLVQNDQGETGFQVLVGGGLGRTPVIGKEINPFLEKRHLLSYLEAILRIYNLQGRRDNMYKARIKILVNALGIDEFRRLVEEEWAQIKDNGLELDQENIQRMQGFFAPPAYEKLNDGDALLIEKLANNPLFATWYKHNTADHKQAGYRVAFISLKAPTSPAGDATDVQLETIADLADRYSFGEVQTTHNQNLVLKDIKQSQLFELWQALGKQQLATPNIGTLTDMIVCPGGTFCDLANANSIDIGQQINDKFDTLDYLYDLGDVSIKISGCMNACGHHHIADIGVLGVEKSGQEWYQITLGGSPGLDAAIGKRLGRSVEKERVADVIGEIIDIYVEQRSENESFAEVYKRIGIDAFKERVYATN